MATLETIRFSKFVPHLSPETVEWKPACPAVVIAKLPQIFWTSGQPWLAPNLWALDQVAVKKRKAATVSAAMGHLLAYAKWLEVEQLHWLHFPDNEADRCLTRYRGFLVEQRDHQIIHSSTASARMSAVVRFYRWAKQNRLVPQEAETWNERDVRIRFTGNFGLEHTMQVASTDLSIPRTRSASSIELEDGVAPVSVDTMNAIVRLAEEKAPIEVSLMLRIGFQTGMRLGSICDLRLETLMRAVPHPLTGWPTLWIGPQAQPPVRTKFGKTGRVLIPPSLLADLRIYASSTRRLKRASLAQSPQANLLFLTRSGSSYGDENNKAVSVAMGRLRRNGASNSGGLWDFYFHRTRATFASNLMAIALRHLPVADAIAFVRDACMHKDEKTTLGYVRFVNRSKAAAEIADEFSSLFLHRGAFDVDRK